MAYFTLSGRHSTDPHFDPRSLRPGYTDWHGIHTDVEDREPIIGLALTVSYRVFSSYTDAGERRVDRIEMLQHQTMEDRRRGREAIGHALNPLDRAEGGILALLAADAETRQVARQIEDDVERHQADRDEDYAAGRRS